MPDSLNELNKFVLITLTQNGALIWEHGLNKGALPEKISAPADKASHHHVRQTQHQGGHSGDPADFGFFDVIAKRLDSASEILLISHGHGKANTAFRFKDFLADHNPDIAKKIVGTIDLDLSSTSENQILSTARTWAENFHRTGLKSQI